MIFPYEQELHVLQNWMNDVNRFYFQNPQPVSSAVIIDIRNSINILADKIGNGNPFYANKLKEIWRSLFSPNAQGYYYINNFAYGQLLLIIENISNEPSLFCFWSEIHPRICKVAYSLFADGHYSNASDSAVKEIEVRLKEKYHELKPDTVCPSSTSSVIGALFSDKGSFKFCDGSNESGKNYRRGIHELFEGIITAYRNPSAHGNLQYSKREAIERIMLASQS